MVTGDKRAPSDASWEGGAGAPDLSYAVELWDLPRLKVERIIARADMLVVARAIFETAVAENPSRRLVLRHGETIIAERN
jgi:hypothetical protein